MADTKLTGLTANTTPALTDLVYLVDDPAGTPLSQKITVAALLATPSATLVTPVLGAATATSVAATGRISANTEAAIFDGPGVAGDRTASLFGLNDLISGASGLGLNVSSSIMWDSASNLGGGTVDLRLYRDAAGILAQRNGANAQSFRIYGTWTDASNYERASLSHVTGTGVLLAAQTAGTGGDDLEVRLTPAGTGKVVTAAGMDAASYHVGGAAGVSFGPAAPASITVVNGIITAIS